MKTTFALNLTASALAMALGCGMATAAPEQSAPAADSRLKTLILAEAESSVADDLDRISDDGLDALQQIYAARIAIFEGDPKEAAELIAEAQADLKDAAKDAEKIGIKGKQGAVQVPIDARLTLADDFVLTPAKAEKIAKVDAHLKKGETKEAVEVLREAGIYLNISVVLLPLDSARSALEKAAKMVEEGHFYDANLALKSIEDSVVVDSVSFVEWLETAPQPAGKG